MSDFLVRPSVGSAIARPRTYLNMVLDASSSMAEVHAATIAAFNAFLDGQRHDRVDELFVTLTLFGDPGRVKTVYKAVPMAQVPVLTEDVYTPEDGSTALYDGVYKALKAIEKDVGRQARVLTVVITDGQDNASREVTSAGQLKRIIEDHEKRGNWTFVFLAATPSAFEDADSMGFPRGNVEVYTVGDVGEAMATVGRGVTGYRHSDSMQTKDFYGAPKFRRTAWAQGGEE